MPTEKERFEILLEDIQGNVKLALEGHSVLSKQIQDAKDDLENKIVESENRLKIEIGKVRTELKSDIKNVDTKVDILSNKVTNIDNKIDKHILQPAHA